MALFSERIGLVNKEVLQTTSISVNLRNDLWNSIQKHYLDKVYYKSSIYGDEVYSTMTLGSCSNRFIILNIWENFFVLQLHDVERESLRNIKTYILKQYNSLEWFRVYEFVEFLIKNEAQKKDFIAEVNMKLERNNSGFRIIGNEISPIINEIEIQEINQARFTKFPQVNKHIEKALELFSKKPEPDYENTIKESITAVESICNIIVGKACTLSDALKILKNKGVVIHPTLNKAFENLYGYTSDASGVRHSGNLGGKDSTYEEAKFMLVSCCAFINYLTLFMN